MSDIKCWRSRSTIPTLLTNQRFALPLPQVGALRTLHVNSVPQSRPWKSWPRQTLPLQGRTLCKALDLQLRQLLAVWRPRETVVKGIRQVLTNCHQKSDIDSLHPLVITFNTDIKWKYVRLKPLKFPRRRSGSPERNGANRSRLNKSLRRDCEIHIAIRSLAKL